MPTSKRRRQKTSPRPRTTRRPTTRRGAAEDVLRLRGPASLVSATPYLVGFVPERSLVLVALDEDAPRARVVGSARIDLDPDPVSVLRAFVRQAVNRGSTGVMVLVYDDQVAGQPLAHSELIERVEGLLADEGLRLFDALYVRDEDSVWRWWSYLCVDQTCCPASGLTVARSSPVDAEAVGRGLVALGSRRDLVAELLPDAAAVAAVTAKLEPWSRCVADHPRWRSAEVSSIDETILRSARGVSEPEARDRTCDASPDLMARHLVALADVGVRDLVLVQPERDEIEAALRYWRRLVCAAPMQLRAPAATLLAVACLQSGDGARANVALDVALAAEPDYNLAGLVAVALSSGAVTPDDLVSSLAKAHAEERRRLSGLLAAAADK